jgi:transposase
MDVPLTEEMIAQQSPEAQAIIRSLLEIIVQQQEKIESLPSQADQLTIQTRTLTARVQELEAMLDLKKKTPLNSSVPPSTEHPHAKSLPAKPATKRPRGGQPGHPKHERPLLDSEDSDEVVPLKPTVCRRCGKALEGVDSEPLRHQVWEIPQPQPIVIEDQRQRLTCACGCTTCAPLPEGVPEHTSGPRLIATAAFLMACCGLSKSRAAFTLATLFGVPVSPALTVKFQEHATAALAPCYEELKAALPERATANCDETPTKQGSNKAWIWVATTQVFTVFVIALTRAATVVQGLLGV